MKSKHLIILSTVFLILLTLFVLNRFNQNSFKKDSTNFSFTTSSKATEIIISKGTSDAIILFKQGVHWRTKAGNTIQAEKIDVLFGAFKNLKMLSPVSNHDKDEIIKLLESSGTKVEIERDSKNIYKINFLKYKDKTVGRIAKNQPFYIEIHGYSHVNMLDLIGLNESDWIDNLLFDFSQEQLKVVELNYPERTENGYTIVSTAEGPKLFDFNKNLIDEIKSSEINDYLHFFTGINTVNLAKQKFGMKGANCIFELNLTTAGQQKFSLQGFPLYENNANNVSKGYFLGIVNQIDTVYLKYTDFDPLLLSIDNFLKK